MGYTNYFKVKELKDGFSEDFLNKVKRMIKCVTEDFEIELTNFDYDDDGNEIPMPVAITKHEICFGGGSDSTCELCQVMPKNKFFFCKTNRLPYDCAVKALGLLLEGQGYLAEPFEWNGTTEEAEFDMAMTVLERANLLSSIDQTHVEQWKK